MADNATAVVVRGETEVQEVHQTAVSVMPYAENLARAIDRGMDTATISKLMDLQERWEANQAKKAFVDAMAGFKRDCPAVIGKDKRADFGAGRAKYSYATTGAIVTAITPHLSRYGLSLSWETKQEGKTVTVTCHVTHAAGHRESATLTGPFDESGGKNPIQTIGSSVHYLQRYTLVSVLGLSTADMDDPDNNPQRPPVAMPTETTPRQSRPQNTADQLSPMPAVTGLVEDFKQKGSKGKDDQPTKCHWVKVCGKWYSFFDDKMGDLCATCFADNVPVSFIPVPSKDGKHVDVTELTAVEAAK